MRRINQILLNYISRVFFVDTRSLALFRICLGLLMIVNFSTAALRMDLFFTNEGVLPPAFLHDIGVFSYPNWSIHVISGDRLYVGLVFLVSGFFAVLFLIGYKTRIASIACFVLVISLHSRSGLFMNAGDKLLNLLLMWSMFMPLGERYSVESALPAARERSRVPSRIATHATAGILLQVIYAYLFSVPHKWASYHWSTTGDALYYAMNSNVYATPLGHMLGEFPVLCRFLTWSTLGVEHLGPLLLFLPWKNQYLRLVVMIPFIFFHCSHLLLFEIGLFPYVGIIAWILFLPPLAWDKLRPETPSARIEQSTAGAFLSIALIVSITVINIVSSIRAKDRFPGVLYDVARFFQFAQGWSMFRHPEIPDKWFLVTGTLSDGSEVDLNYHIHYSEDDRFGEDAVPISDARWRHYIFNLASRGTETHYELFGRFHCRKWDREHEGTTLQSLRAEYLTRSNPPPYSDRKNSPFLKSTYDHDCATHDGTLRKVK